MDVVGAVPAPVYLRIGAHDVVVREDVGEPEFFDALGLRAPDFWISTELGLREHNSNTHLPFNHPVPHLLPAQRVRAAQRAWSRCHVTKPNSQEFAPRVVAESTDPARHRYVTVSA